MTKQKTIPELQAEIAANERQLAQLQHKQQQLENRRSYYEKGDRRKRAQAYHPWGGHLLQFCRAICSPGVWRSGAYPGGIRGNPQA